MTTLPNMRLLGLSSSVSGRDWDGLTKKIDVKIEEEGFDLAEETIIIEFKNGEASVYRPVIGGLRELSGPWLLTDRTSTQLTLKTLDGELWDDIMDEIQEENFTLLLKRRLGSELNLTAQFFSFF